MASHQSGGGPICSGTSCPHARQVRYLEGEIAKMKDRMLTLDRFARGKNLIFYGISTEPGTKWEVLVRDHLARIGQRYVDIDTIIPMDGPIVQGMMPLLVSFVKMKDAKAIFNKKLQLEVRPILVCRDLPEEDMIAEQQLELTYQNLRRLHYNKFARVVRNISGNKMTVWRNGCVYAEFVYNFQEKRVVEKLDMMRQPVFSQGWR